MLVLGGEGRTRTESSGRTTDYRQITATLPTMTSEQTEA